MPDPKQVVQPMQMIGPIGCFEIDGVQYNGIELADVVAYVSMLPKDTKELNIDFSTLGGLKPEGDSIYNYLYSLRSKYQICFNQVGPIGSIGTKIIFAGQRRIALDDGTNNWMIHNPWTDQRGDAAALEARAVTMREEETELVNFYCKQTGINEEGIRPLLNVETTFNADKAVAMKFATEKRTALKIAAYMKTNKNESLGQRLDALLLHIQKAVSPTKAMVLLNIAGGTCIAVNAPDPTQLKGAQAFTCDQSGNPTQTPAPDGDYQVDQDDMTFTVKGGVVTSVNDPDAGGQVGSPNAAGAQSGVAAQVSAMVKAAEANPAKALTLQADLKALLAKPQPKPKGKQADPDEEEDEPTEKEKQILAFVNKIEKLVNPESPENLEAKVLAKMDEKFKELKSSIKTQKKPAIKVFQRADEGVEAMTPAERYLRS